MNTNELDSLIVEVAYAGCQLQADNGAMPSGHNGPHRHKMTPARNTGHWAITFLHAFQISQDDAFRIAATKCLDLLISPALRPIQGAFWHRCHTGSNSFNGLIGQSWSLEALYYGWQILANEQYRAVALEVFNQHLYHNEMGVWYQLDLDGSACVVERTLNQQVWLAAMGISLAQDEHPHILAMVENFLTKLPAKILPTASGALPMGLLWRKSLPHQVKHLLMRDLGAGRDNRRQREFAYHIFTLCGLAQLYRHLPNHSIWSTPFFQKALRYSFHPTFHANLSTTDFGYPYNVPGFELPYVFSIFQHLVEQHDAKEICRRTLQQQMDRHYNEETHLLEQNTPDSATLAARFYEICRIPRAFFTAS